ELRKLMDEKRQKEMLVPVEVKAIDARENRYEIHYKRPDGSLAPPRTVVLANRPEGDTPAKRADTVKAQASVLPDLSVEQIFVSEERQGKKQIDPNKSYFFNVRTSEKEPELVQAALDQLLQEKKEGGWRDLLKKVFMEILEDRLTTTREV